MTLRTGHIKYEVVISGKKIEFRLSVNQVSYYLWAHIIN